MEPIWENDILNSVIDIIRRQTEKGLKKYGKTVDPNSHTTIEWIEHAQMESIDFIIYLETLKRKIKNGM